MQKTGLLGIFWVLCHYSGGSHVASLPDPGGGERMNTLYCNLNKYQDYGPIFPIELRYQVPLCILTAGGTG